MKRVIAACLDIGRTLSREIAGVAIVGPADCVVTWHSAGNEIISRGRVLSQDGTAGGGALTAGPAETAGTLPAWLLWNLTGVYAPAGARSLGRTRARAPFDAELPVVALVEEPTALAQAGQAQGSDTDRRIAGAAELAWQTIATER